MLSKSNKTLVKWCQENLFFICLSFLPGKIFERWSSRQLGKPIHVSHVLWTHSTSIKSFLSLYDIVCVSYRTAYNVRNTVKPTARLTMYKIPLGLQCTKYRTAYNVRNTARLTMYETPFKMRTLGLSLGLSYVHNTWNI